MNYLFKFHNWITKKIKKKNWRLGKNLNYIKTEDTTEMGDFFFLQTIYGGLEWYLKNVYAVNNKEFLQTLLILEMKALTTYWIHFFFLKLIFGSLKLQTNHSIRITMLQSFFFNSSITSSWILIWFIFPHGFPLMTCIKETEGGGEGGASFS